MILDKDAQYALVKPNIVFQLDGNLIEWPGSEGLEKRKLTLRTLFKIESKVWKNRKTKLSVDWMEKTCTAFVHANDLFEITLDEYYTLQKVWKKQDQISIIKKNILQDEHDIKQLQHKVIKLSDAISCKEAEIEFLKNEIKPLMDSIKDNVDDLEDDEEFEDE